MTQATATIPDRITALHQELRQLKDKDDNPIDVFELSDRNFLTRLAWRLQVLVAIPVVVIAAANLLPTLWAVGATFPLAIVFGFFMTQIGLLAHDVGHKSALNNKSVQFWLGLVLGNGILAVCHSWWNTKHNQHHATPNDPDEDPDVRIPVAEFDLEHALTRSRWMQPILRHQHWLFPIFFTLQALNTQIVVTGPYLWKETRRSLRKDAAGRSKTLGRLDLSAQWVALFLHWGIVAASWYMAGPVVGSVFFFTFMMAHGFANSSIFAPNHKPMPRMKRGEEDMFGIQTKTACNVHGGRWVAFWYGTLRYQIEHHLFTKVPSDKIHLIAPTVEKHCKMYDVPYTSMSPWGAWKAIYNLLRDVANELQTRHKAAKRLRKAA